jgi:hypothetical protein
MTRYHEPDRGGHSTLIEVATTEASDARTAVDRHPRTTEPDLTRVQAGWRVYDRIGHRLGEVIDRDDASVVVSRGPAGGDDTRVPIKLIAYEDPAERTAVITTTAGEPEHPDADGREV